MDIGDNEDFHSGRGVETLERRAIEINVLEGEMGE